MYLEHTDKENTEETVSGSEKDTQRGCRGSVLTTQSPCVVFFYKDGPSSASYKKDILFQQTGLKVYVELLEDN